MSVWPIERQWHHLQSNGERRLSTTPELSAKRVLCLHGGAGLGKTFELRKLAELERLAGSETRFGRLAVLASGPHGLAQGLGALCVGATPETTVYLDAFDEALVAEKKSALTLLGWIEGTGRTFPGRLRVTSRAATWPHEVTAALREAFGGDNVVVADLAALSDDDIAVAATVEGLDAKKFRREVDRAGATALAKQPLSLRMLIKLFSASGRLPARRDDLFREGLHVLACEPRERRDMNTASPLTPDALLSLAEDVACLTLIGGHECLSFADEPRNGDVSWRQVVALPRSKGAITEELLKHLGSSSLFEKDDSGACRFVHRQLAEYLAGRRLARLPVHQARALLASDLGWQRGVAGPLREVAAFAASHSAGLADWVSECDPEIVGLSDVASDQVRKRATAAMMARFERRELTDSQVGRDGMVVVGLKYAKASGDLRAKLRVRGPKTEDLLEFVIELVEEWGLSDLSKELADLALDRSAPLTARLRASYALVKIGTSEAKRRLQPLIVAGPEDSLWQLKGVALRCNWPDELTVQELLSALTKPPQRSFHGAYEGFLWHLEEQEFKADGARVDGLKWAATQFDELPDSYTGSRLGAAIAAAALDELNDPQVLDALVDLMLAANAANAASPLRVVEDRVSGQSGTKPGPPLAGRTAERHLLLARLASKLASVEDLWMMASETPGLLETEDFAWACRCAVENGRSEPERKHYAEIARMLMDWSPANLTAWLAVRDREPLASMLNWRTEVVLDSDEAREAKRLWEERKTLDARRKPKPAPPRPDPETILNKLLTACEADAFQFHRLPAFMSANDEGRLSGFGMFFAETGRWGACDEPTRERLVQAAQRFLDDGEEFRRQIQRMPLKEGNPAGVAALDLVMHECPRWLAAKKPAWWAQWTWHLLRELRPACLGEPDEPRRKLLKLIHKHDPVGVRRHIYRLARGEVAESQSLCVGLISTLQGIPDRALDGRLCDLIGQGAIPADRVRQVAGFVLARRPDEAAKVCLSQVKKVRRGARVKPSETTIQVAAAMLDVGGSEVWDHTIDLLEARVTLATRALGEHLHSDTWRKRDQSEGGWEPSATQIGRLVSVLMECYPTKDDPEHDEVYWAGPRDSAIDVRQRMVNWLGDQATPEAIQVLEGLERRFADREPWLRRPRARAARSFRLSQWKPTSMLLIAEVLESAERRLIRSEDDALDGVCEAVRQFNRDLHHQHPSELADLWVPAEVPKAARGKGTRRRKAGTLGGSRPREEEHCSDKLCAVIRTYFEKYAVVADREVQVRRRRVPKERGGIPGSDLDVLVTVPAAGSWTDEAIRVPVEVKRSCFDEAKTALRTQLVDRYALPLGAACGAFVVMWFDAPGLEKQWKPVWNSIEEAQADLDEQARLARRATGVRIVPVIVNCSIK